MAHAVFFWANREWLPLTRLFRAPSRREGITALTAAESLKMPLAGTTKNDGCSRMKGRRPLEFFDLIF